MTRAHRTRRGRLGVLLFLLAAPNPAAALWDDRIELFVAQAVYRDDNVLRVPQDAGPAADEYSVTSFGFGLDAPFERQRVLGGLTLNSVHYDTFGQFDLDGHDGRFVWQWRPGEARHGELGFSHRRALASLANLQDGVQSSVPNALTTQEIFAAGGVGFGQCWLLELVASRLEQRNGAAERRVNDLDLDQGEASLACESRASNRLGVRARAGRGVLPNPQSIGGVPVDNSYRQRELGAFGDWRPGANTRLRARAGRVWRDYEQIPERDFEGGVWELKLDWAPTGRIELAALAQKDISPNEEIHLSFVLAERYRVEARYRLGGKSELSAGLETGDRKYLGDAAQALGAVPPLTERLSAAGLQASYRPLRRVTLTLSLRRETRDSDLAGADYTADVVGLGARIGF